MIYVRIIAANHFSIRNLVAKAVSGFVRIYRHIKNISRMPDGRESKRGGAFWSCCNSNVLLTRFFTSWAFINYSYQGFLIKIIEV